MAYLHGLPGIFMWITAKAFQHIATWQCTYQHGSKMPAEVFQNSRKTEQRIKYSSATNLPCDLTQMTACYQWPRIA